MNRTPEIRELEVKIGVINMLRRQAQERIAHFNVKCDPCFHCGNDPDPIALQVLTPVRDEAVKELERLHTEFKVLCLKLKTAMDAAGIHYNADDWQYMN